MKLQISSSNQVNRKKKENDAIMYKLKQLMIDIMVEASIRITIRIKCALSNH